MFSASFVPALPAQGDLPPATPVTDTTTIVNRSQKAQKLLLRMPNGLSYRMLQHKSHASHSSHASHYSGSTGSAPLPSAPAPAPRPLTTPSPSPAQPLAEMPPPPAGDAKFFDGVIDAINKEARTMTVRQTLTNTSYTLGYRDDTKFRSIAGEESRLDDLLEKSSGVLPFRTGQKIRVSWKAGAASKNIAVTIAPFK
jgi:hypothetical protein